MSADGPALQITGMRKSYGSLRPLRIQSLAIAAGERVAMTGLDAAAAEMMVNLVTGASLPDEGEIRVFGRSTVDVRTAEAWLASLDRFGIVTDRAVILEAATLAQNLTMPFTLEIDPIEPETLERVVRLANECDIAPQWLDQKGGALPPAVRARTHLARAIALGPALLLMEHPTAALPEAERGAFGCRRRPRVRGARDDRARVHARHGVCRGRGAAHARAQRRHGGASPGEEGLVPVTTCSLGEHPARHPGASADAGFRRAGDALIRISMDDDCAAVGVEQRQRAVREGHARRHTLQHGQPAGVGLEVGNVAHVERVVRVRIRCYPPGPGRNVRPPRRSPARTCRPRAGARRATPA